jgi:hypothetical protein
MRSVLADVSGVSTMAEYFTMDERLIAEPVNCMTIAFATAADAERVSELLLSGEPSIATVVLDSKLVVAVDTLLEGQHLAIAGRLRPILA